MKKCTEWKASRKCGTCAKSWTRWMKYHFLNRWHVGSLVWNMRANFKRGLKTCGRSLWSLHSVAYRRARSSRNFWLLKYGCALLPFLFSWFYPLWFLRVYANEIAASRMPLKFRNDRWQSYTQFRKVSSSGAPNSGRIAGTVTRTL
jgi:hypothetical protein